MLKLEKQSYWGEIHVTVRHRERLFTPTFILALGIAVCIHFVGLIVFSIKPYFVRDAAHIFPPSQVAIDFSSGSNGVESEIAVDRRKSFPGFDLPLSMPAFPEVPPIKRMKEQFDDRELALKKDPFGNILRGASLDGIQFLEGSTSSVRPVYPIDIRISGGLSRLQILDEGWLDMDFPGVGFGKKAKKYHAGFDVKIDDSSGRIFWYKAQNPFKKASLNAYAEKILNNMLFKKDPNGLVTQGKVEITFYCIGI